nr:uncharacterized protein LOC133614916 [Nerophis lumbriciformis]
MYEASEAAVWAASLIRRTYISQAALGGHSMQHLEVTLHTPEAQKDKHAFRKSDHHRFHLGINGSLRDATWTDSMANQAHHKSKPAKDEDQVYKSHIDDSGLYNRGEDDLYKNPLSEEMQRKIYMESERLRARLRQELAELRERLDLSPSPRGATLAAVRQRLSPITQQLLDSLSSSAHRLCDRLRLHLGRQEDPRDFHWMTQTLQRGTSELAAILDDLAAQTSQVTERLGETSEAVNREILQDFASRLGREVSALKVEVQKALETLKAELARDDADGALERFCQSAARQLDFQARMERMFTGMEEETSPSLSGHSEGSLQEDFSVKLSALIQDILHSVQ